MNDRTDADNEDAAAPDGTLQPQQDHAAAQDTEAAALPFSAREAATALGVSERTIRRAIQRGELTAVKHSGTFHITPQSLETYRSHPTGQSGQSVLSRAATTDSHAAAADGNASDFAAARDNVAAAQDSGPGAADAVVVLRELLTEERNKSDALLEASLIWQTRALQLQERLAQLEAGPITVPAHEHANAPDNVIEAPQRDEGAQMGNQTLQEPTADPVPTEVQLATGWRRWWRRVLGYEG